MLRVYIFLYIVRIDWALSIKHAEMARKSIDAIGLQVRDLRCGVSD